jgi:hypothetical protein
MSEPLRREMLDISAVHERLGSYWKQPSALGDDSWIIDGPGGIRIIISYDPETVPGQPWVHASVSYESPMRIPSYMDLKRMHHAVFGSGHAYQVFVPNGEHINIRDNVLHLWGRFDGQPALPNFGHLGTI